MFPWIDVVGSSSVVVNLAIYPLVSGHRSRSDQNFVSSFDKLLGAEPLLN